MPALHEGHTNESHPYSMKIDIAISIFSNANAEGQAKFLT
jgi:hypothetical protein